MSKKCLEAETTYIQKMKELIKHTLAPPFPLHKARQQIQFLCPSVLREEVFCRHVKLPCCQSQTQVSLSKYLWHRSHLAGQVLPPSQAVQNRGSEWVICSATGREKTQYISTGLPTWTDVSSIAWRPRSRVWD